MPAYNESENIDSVLKRIQDQVNLNFECLVVVDRDTDSTVPKVRAFSQTDDRIRCVINRLGKGPASAIRAGILESQSPVVIVMMADGSDDPRDINELVLLIERGIDVACASRYMPSGQQIGAPLMKSTLSRLAGKSLFMLARVGTRDATNSFKAYRKDFLNAVGIEAAFGFEMGIELVAKAKKFGYTVAEVPTIWIERSTGESNFNLYSSIPKYLKWYFFAFSARK